MVWGQAAMRCMSAACLMWALCLTGPCTAVCSSGWCAGGGRLQSPPSGQAAAGEGAAAGVRPTLREHSTMSITNTHWTIHV